MPLDELARRTEGRLMGNQRGTVAIARQQLEEMIPFFDLPVEAEMALFDRSEIRHG